MLHLDPERLAALADTEPTPDEAAHLAHCEACARERAAYRELLVVAGRERSAVLAEPLTEWSALSARLDEEGLIHAGAARGRTVTRFRRHRWMQAAAGVMLAVGGAVVGRATAAYPLGGGGAGGTGTRVASGRIVGVDATSDDSAHAMVSVDDALALMRRAENDYRLAAAYVAAHDTTPSRENGVDRYRTRLAALDRVTDAALAAVNEAPADPVINQYLISTRTARAVTLQQLNSSLPAGVTLASY
jgi:hypothetical protein